MLMFSPPIMAGSSVGSTAHAEPHGTTRMADDTWLWCHDVPAVRGYDEACRRLDRPSSFASPGGRHGYGRLRPNGSCSRGLRKPTPPGGEHDRQRFLALFAAQVQLYRRAATG